MVEKAAGAGDGENFNIQDKLLRKKSSQTTLRRDVRRRWDISIFLS